MDNLKLLDNRSEIKIKTFLAKIQERSEVLGVMVLGGLGKHQRFDNFSDVDLVIVVDQNKDNSWLPEFEFRIPSRNPSEQIGVNLHQVTLENLQSSTWDISRKEAYYNGIIVYDPRGLIDQQVAKNTIISRKDQYRELMFLASKIPPYVQINPARQLERGYTMAAINILNQGVDYLIDALYWINQNHIPSAKWRIVNLEKLSWKPPSLLLLLEQIYSDPSTEKRIELTSSIAEMVLKKIEEITETDALELYHQACGLILGRQINMVPFAKQVYDKLASSDKFIKADIELLRDGLNINLYSEDTSSSDIEKLIEDLDLDKSMLKFIIN